MPPKMLFSALPTSNQEPTLSDAALQNLIRPARLTGTGNRRYGFRVDSQTAGKDRGGDLNIDVFHVSGFSADNASDSAAGICNSDDFLVFEFVSAGIGGWRDESAESKLGAGARELERAGGGDTNFASRSRRFRLHGNAEELGAESRLRRRQVGAEGKRRRRFNGSVVEINKVSHRNGSCTGYIDGYGIRFSPPPSHSVTHGNKVG